MTQPLAAALTGAFGRVLMAGPGAGRKTERQERKKKPAKTKQTKPTKQPKNKANQAAKNAKHEEPTPKSKTKQSNEKQFHSSASDEKKRGEVGETSDLEFLTYSKHARANVWRLG